MIGRITDADMAIVNVLARENHLFTVKAGNDDASPSLMVKSVWYSLSMKRITRWSLSGFGKAITPMMFTGSRSVILFHLYRSKK